MQDTRVYTGSGRRLGVIPYVLFVVIVLIVRYDLVVARFGRAKSCFSRLPKRGSLPALYIRGVELQVGYDQSDSYKKPPKR